MITMDERIVDGTFRFRLLGETPNGVLLKYLKSQSTVFSHELILTAARAFWLSEAYLYFGVKQDSDLKKKVQHMIFALEDRAAYLRMMFGIEPRPIFRCGDSSSDVCSLPELEEEEVEQEVQTVWDSIPQIETGGL